MPETRTDALRHLLRSQLDLRTQENIAWLSGIHPATLSRFLAGKQSLSEKTKRAMKKAIRIDKEFTEEYSRVAPSADTTDTEIQRTLGNIDRLIKRHRNEMEELGRLLDHRALRDVPDRSRTSSEPPPS
jgi:hypothetical protein